ncbi:hypothetical protein FHR38_002460 [Micromonospora polyrhachis]|uniref:Uncharacterized protein n=1 Tax=Micromonospora polyrhachis TaxID=1282883 RepID=A0A7W7WPN4_9ACTN|nr:hypothetical protein [Micromonospora polyrhachis]
MPHIAHNVQLVRSSPVGHGPLPARLVGRGSQQTVERLSIATPRGNRVRHKGENRDARD